jgi:hypothetical protein
MQGRDWIYDTEDHFWVDHCSLDGGSALRRYSLGGVVAELWFHSVSVRCLR